MLTSPGTTVEGCGQRSTYGGMRMKFVRSFVWLAAATALVVAGGLSSSPVLTSPAEAATVKVSYPKKPQTSVKVYRLQQRLVRAKVLKARDQTGHFNVATVAAIKKFQLAHQLPRTGKVNKATWTALVAATGATPEVTVKTLDKRCQVHGRAICVDKTLRKLYYVKNSKVLQIMDARFGSRWTPTREGRFSIRWKSRNHTSSIFGVYMPYAMFFNGGQAVHWSAAFKKHGYHGASHGCVNIRDKAGIRWLFDQMRVGDRVVVYRS